MNTGAGPEVPYVLIENPAADGIAGGTWLYEDPVETLVAAAPEEIVPALTRLQARLETGWHVAGHIAYEAGHAFEARLRPLYRPPQGPLLAFGVFATRRAYRWPERPLASPPLALEPRWSLTTYRQRFGQVIDYLLAGDLYQANLTFPLEGRIGGDPLELYAALRQRQKPRHGALVALTPQQTLLSLSPELFFAIEAGQAGRIIRARPMKGTAPRGATPQADADSALALAASEKDRAENLMIVDLLRNDLGRLAEIGSVEVSDLFSVERYETLFQMTSGVMARLRPKITLAEVFAALFPCGSVTGAPKIRAIEILRDLEDSPRGAYCGAIGHATPEGDARFNVAIRTAILDSGGGITLNVGSGVTHDSQAGAEYDECWLKARFLTG